MKYDYKKKIEINKNAIVELCDGYKKKPIEIQAIQYFKDDFFDFDVADWIAEAVEKEVLFYCCIQNDNGKYTEELFIETLEGTMHVSEGDYIIKGIKGELYSCKPDIFKETYEEITYKTDYNKYKEFLDNMGIKYKTGATTIGEKVNYLDIDIKHLYNNSRHNPKLRINFDSVVGRFIEFETWGL